MTNNNNTIIHASEVTKNYVDLSSNLRFQALRGVDLFIRRGSFSSIIGPSGAGKTTLLNIMGGMTKLTTGTMHVDGYPVHTLDKDGLNYFHKQVVGFLWQFPERNLLPTISAIDNIMFSMNISNYSRTKRKKFAEELLASVGLKDRMHHKLGQLSGGEAQRASLAVALANEPQVLFADEPTGELDSVTTLEIINYLKELNKERGLTVVVVTHDPRFAKMTDQSYSILDGTIAGLKRPISKGQDDWTGVVREEISVVNQFGMVKIPANLLEKYKIDRFVEFKENEEQGTLCIRPVDHK